VAQIHMVAHVTPFNLGCLMKNLAPFEGNLGQRLLLLVETVAKWKTILWFDPLSGISTKAWQTNKSFIRWAPGWWLRSVRPETGSDPGFASPEPERNRQLKPRLHDKQKCPFFYSCMLFTIRKRYLGETSLLEIVVVLHIFTDFMLLRL
jgi:hypothetical protein